MPGRLSQASRFRQQGKHNRTSAAERSEIRREAVRPLPLQDALPCPGLAHPGFHSKSSLVFFPLPSNHPMKNSRVIPEEPLFEQTPALMSTNLERYKTDLAKLIELGKEMSLDLLYRTFSDREISLVSFEVCAHKGRGLFK